MNKKDFENKLSRGFFLLDGSTGAELSARGMPAGVSPDLWVLDNPEVFIQMQRDYIAAGSHAVISCTFGSSPFKLRHYGADGRTEEINQALVALSRRAAGADALVAADIGPSGEFIRPMGVLSLDDMIDGYKRQVRGMLQGAPDFFILETFMDVAEARAAVIAIKECCDLPFIVCMTFEGERTLTGATPESVAAIFTAMGASAVGCNCSSGPDSMRVILEKMAQVTHLPLIAQPNAGMPQVVDGKTVFHMQPDTFTQGVGELIRIGATVVGGCCGTTPEHIRQLAVSLNSVQPASRPRAHCMYCASPRAHVRLSPADLVIIGERVNPSGKPDLIAELADLYPDTATDIAREQLSQGAQIIDINAGHAGIDERAALCMLVEDMGSAISAPFSIDSMDADAMCAALRLYPGVALVNSVSPGADAEKLFAAAALYGSIPVLMPMNDYRLPQTVKERMDAVVQLMDIGGAYGFNIANVLVDIVTPPAASAWEGLREAADFAQSAHAMGFTTIAGVSNVSFGLPRRALLNSAWLNALVSRGLSCAIVNPSRRLIDSAYAARAVGGHDDYCMDYLRHIRSGGGV